MSLNTDDDNWRQKYEKDREERITLEEQVKIKQAKIEVLEEEKRSTTLSEYLDLVHRLLIGSIRYGDDDATNTTGTYTKPKEYYCPSDLKLMSNFSRIQARAFSRLKAIIPPNERIFDSIILLKDQQRKIKEILIDSEDHLANIQELAIHCPIKKIMSAVAEYQSARTKFSMKGDIHFDSHLHTLRESRHEAEERAEKKRRRADRRQEPLLNLPLNVPIDQVCTIRPRIQNASPRILYIIEYKAPHKLAQDQVRSGVKSIDIYEAVVNRGTAPVVENAEALAVYKAELYSSAAVTQTYTYMLRLGLNYSYLTTGKTSVFFKIDYARPDILQYYSYFHDTESEVTSFEDGPLYQALAFTLLTLDSSMQSHEVRQKAMEKLNTWTTQDILIRLNALKADKEAGMDTPEEEAALDAGDEDSDSKERSTKSCFDETYQHSSHSPSSSPDSHTQFPSSRTRNRQGPLSTVSTNRTTDPNSPQSGAPGGQTTTNTHQRNNMESKSNQDGNSPFLPFPRSDEISDIVERIFCRSPPEPEVEPLRPYCSKACLVGLVTNGFLDAACPNCEKHLHASASGSKRRSPSVSFSASDLVTSDSLQMHHPLSHEQWLDCLENQLRNTLDRGIRPLGIHGSRGVLMQLTLLEYGYVFLAKTTTRAFMPDLQFEEKIYRRIKSLQGVHVPVHLGSIDLSRLDKIYYYGIHTDLEYFMLLSYAGEFISADLAQKSRDIRGKLRMAYDSLHAQGILHRDIREENILQDEYGNVALIDFERALYVHRLDLDHPEKVDLTDDVKPSILISPQCTREVRIYTRRSSVGDDIVVPKDDGGRDPTDTDSHPKHDLLVARSSYASVIQLERSQIAFLLIVDIWSDQSGEGSARKIQTYADYTAHESIKPSAAKPIKEMGHISTIQTEQVDTSSTEMGNKQKTHQLPRFTEKLSVAQGLKGKEEADPEKSIMAEERAIGGKKRQRTVSIGSGIGTSKQIKRENRPDLDLDVFPDPGHEFEHEAFLRDSEHCSARIPLSQMDGAHDDGDDDGDDDNASEDHTESDPLEDKP